MADHLTIVPKREPDAVEEVRTRVKKMDRPDGMLQCPQCGGRAVCKVESGVIVKNGRKQRGTTIVENACDTCRRLHGIIVEMRTGNEKPERVK